MTIRIKGYKIVERIWYASMTSIYRAIREIDGIDVIVKTLSDEYPRNQDVARLRWEFNVAEKLKHIKGVIEVYSLERYGQGNLAIIMEPFDQAITDFIKKGKPLSIENFLKFALKLTDIIGNIHQNNIIHKDITPRNILIENNFDDIRVIDFGISSELSRERQDINVSKRLEGSLPYISPEQTGRMNRDLDYRSDYYSMGITFYELLTGKLPFQAEDLPGWVHCHISKLPTAPDSINTDIPESISDIILKLISKNAEDRYQSSYGLSFDLEQCHKQWEEKGSIQKFPLGQRDISEKFQIAQKLYGREREMGILMDRFVTVLAGHTQWIMITGDAGVGKSALVHEIQKPIATAKGYFIEGKFDQFQHNMPYTALAQAFKSLVQQLLTEPEAQLTHWKTIFTDVLGPNGQLLLDLVPVLETIIGTQPPVQTLNTEAAQNRFQLVFHDFVSALATEDHPLTLFLDDLQWSDAATLTLLEKLATSEKLSYLFMVGAYRSNEVLSGDLLQLTLDTIQKTKEIHHLTLDPLDVGALNHMLADVLHCPSKRVQSLGVLLFDRIQGNPFFAGELLKNLYQEKVIRFHPEKGKWVWDMRAVRQTQFSDNVIDFLLTQLKLLDPATQHVLQLAACIGNVFDLKTLSIINEQSMAASHQALHAALANGLVVPLDDSYQWVSSDTEVDSATAVRTTHEINPRYQFQHDRVQQAAYALIVADQKQYLHLTIGRLLQQHTAETHLDRRLIEIVRHLNEAQSLIQAQKEREALAQLNLRVALKAKDIFAYASALRYVAVGMELLAKDPWQHQYELIFGLSRINAECNYLTGNNDKAEEQINIMLSHANTPLEKAELLSLQAYWYTLHEKEAEVIQLGIKGLALLGLKFTLNPNRLSLFISRWLIKWKLSPRKIESFLDRPPVHIPEKKMMLILLRRIRTAAHYAGNSNLYLACSLTAVKLCLRFGGLDMAADAFCAYGMLLSNEQFNNPKTGYLLGKLAITLNERVEDAEMKSRISSNYMMIALHNEHWRILTSLSQRALKLAYEAGDIYTIMVNILLSVGFDPTLDLQTSISKLEKCPSIVGDTGYQIFSTFISIPYQTFLNYRGLTNGRFSLDDASFDEMQFLDRMQQQKNYSGIRYYHLWKAEICLLSDNSLSALQHIREMDKVTHAVIGTIFKARYSIVVFLSFSMSYPDMTTKEKKQAWKRLKKEHKKMKKWADHCPVNFLHLQLLMEAEMARLQNKRPRAEQYYDQAIKMANENEYHRDEAMANEWAAKFYLEKGYEKAAEGYLRQAHYFYYRWGAERKVLHLEETYPNFFTDREGLKVVQEQTKKYVTGAEKESTHTSSVFDTKASALDLATVMKATQTITGEIVLENLLQKVMQVVLENAGARSGFLILSQKNKWYIAVEAYPDRVKTHMDTVLFIDNSDVQIPVSIINYIARSKESVVLSNATVEGQFVQDPYIVANHPISILGMPLMHQGHVSGILYLENNLSQGAFTQDRLEVLNLLSSQAAISIEKSMLYNSMQESERKYRTIFEESKDMIFISSVDGKIIDVNPACESLTGYTKLEIMRLNALDIYANLDDRIRFKEAMLKHGTVHDYEIKLQRKDGRVVDVLVTAMVRLAKDGTLPVYHGMIRDITAEKEANMERMRALELKKDKEAADKANEAKSAFLANMSHELRTPLNAIIGFSDILGSSISDPKQKDYLERISTSGGSLLTLINEILDLSKIESGKMELEYSVVSLTKIFNETKRLFEQKSEEKGVDLILNISPTIPDALLLDGKRIRQILINLIGNAVKFTENGSITLTADCRYLDDRTKSVINLTFSVVDTGVGIPEDQQANMFEAFEQVKGQSSEKYGGTGLGLAITKRIAEAMGGRIILESEVGQGSIFIVEIKEVELAAVSELVSDTDEIIDFKAISFGPARVLIVDDIDYNRDLIKSYLEGYGFELNEASNGMVALVGIRKYKPNLILLDMKMPVMDGYEVSEILKNDEHLKEIPIVAVTALALKEDEERISKICDGYLSKPVKRGALIKEMMKYLPHTVKEDKQMREPGKVYGNEEIKRSITMLSPDMLEKLRHATELGDVSALAGLIAQVSKSDAEFADVLSGYADRFEFEEILRMLA
ncbi:MAG: AAA family ATPase [Planctomycetes bacterium]|nr:AAA family ATPase [Planctomycetota bacterium]